MQSFVLQWYENCPSSNLKDILTNPDFYYPETNDDFTKITYGRKYDGVKKQDGFLAVTFDTGNLNAGLITIHQKKFNDKILKNKNLVWNTLLNSTNSEPLIGETVEKQSNEPNSILTQRNDLSTNNYDGIPNLQINYSLSDQNNTSDNDYLAAVENGDMETAQRMVDEAARKAGYKFQMFHQTDADNIHIFDIGLGTHGGTDSETPYGIFTKSNRNDLGLGKNQMPLYVLQWYENCPSSNLLSTSTSDNQ